MFANLCGVFLVVTLLLAGLAPPAHAVLERMGPISSAPSIGGYPAWFQDKSGLAMEFCDPVNQAELNGGWCLLLPPVPASAPEHFPDNFFDEHFYWAASNVSSNGGINVRLTIATEAAFVNGPPVPGDQMTFGRIRLVINPLPFSGSYKVYHPYGDWNFPNLVAGDRLFFTEDIGVACPGSFTCTLGTSIGPFLLPSATPGGPEVPAIPDLGAGQDPWHDALIAAGGATPYPGTGKKYIADPARLGPVTGSPLPPFLGNDGQMHDHNTLRVEGPNGFVVDLPANFTLMGRVMTGQVPGQVQITRASYTAPDKLDVFANAYSTVQSRLPAQPTPPAVTPILSFFDAPCGGALTTDPSTGVTTVNLPPYSAPAGATEVYMAGNGNTFWAQKKPASIPSYVCVEDYTSRNALGQVVPAFYLKQVTDEITIGNPLLAGQLPGAYFDGPGGGTLTVRAYSSDPAAQLTLAGFGTGIDLVGGVATVTGIIAPPAKIQVVSSAGGSAELPVATAVGAAVLSGVPVAVSDELTMSEDCSAAPASLCATPLVIAPLANDTLDGAPIPAGAILTITVPPRIGTMVLNADNTISYTPYPNTNGTEGIGYTVTVAGKTSDQAYITIVINPVPDPPVAVADSVGAIRGIAGQVNVLANDTDPDGSTDLAGAQIVTGNANLGLVAGSSYPGGIIAFTPLATLAAGPQTFSYRAVDGAGLTSAPATVTVNVSAGEAITVAKSIYTASKGRWTVSGTDSVRAGQTLTIKYDPATAATYRVNGVCSGNAAGALIGTAVVDAAGAWTYDQAIASTIGVLNPSNTGNSPTNFWCVPPRTLLITSSQSTATAKPSISVK